MPDGRPTNEILVVAGSIAPQTLKNAARRAAAMPNQSRLLRDHSLAVSVAAALAVKAVALAVLYLAFFAPPPNPASPADRAAAAVLGFPAARP